MKRGFAIKHLMPSPDWFAVYQEDDGGLSFVPLVAWAVVAHRTTDGYDDVVRMIYDRHEGVTPAEEENMVGVIHESQRSDARDYIRKLSAK